MTDGSTGRVRLLVLGPCDVRDPVGREVRSVITQSKRLALLSYIALAGRDRFRRRDTVVGLFWPEGDQRAARASLRQALSWLRHELGSDALTHRGEEEIGVAADHLWCDAVAFDEAITSQDPEQALTLYRGDLLEGVFVAGAAPELQRWLDDERVRQRHQATRAARDLAERDAAAGRRVSAVEWSRRAVLLSPNDEASHRQLLQLLAAAGDRAGALEAYAAFRERLVEDYGTEPSAETTRLVSEMRISTSSERRSREATPDGGSTTRPTVPSAASTVLSKRDVLPNRGRLLAGLLAIVALATTATGAGVVRLWLNERLDAAPGARHFTERAIVAGLAASPARATPRRPPGSVAHSATSNPDAYRLLLTAEYHLAKRNNEAFVRAEGLIRQAIELDPLYANAYAVLAQTYQGYAWYGHMPADEAFGKAEAAAQSALALDSTSGLGHAMLAATLSFYRYRWAEGDEEFRRAIALDPEDAYIRNFYALHLRSLGRIPEALAQIRRAREMDQLYRHYYWATGYTLTLAGKDEDAIVELRRALRFDSTYWRAREELAGALARRGRYDAALREMDAGFTIAGDTEKAQVVAAARGKPGYQDAQRRLAAIDAGRLRLRARDGEYVSAFEQARALRDVGDREAAITQLERAYAVRDPRVTYVRLAPEFRVIASDPRVRALAQAMNLP